MQSSLPRNLYELDPTQGEIEWRKYLQNIEMEKKKTSERSRMQELENWLHHINEN